MTIVSSGSLPPITYGSGAAFLGNASLPGIEDILLFVDKSAVTGSEDGTRQNPFHTIANALIAAAALTPGASRKVTILIYPGEYSEDGLNSVDYCSWVGIGGRDAVRIEGDSAEVLTVDDEHTSYWGITFAQTGAFPIVTVNTGTATPMVEFHECAFEGAGSNAQVVNLTGAGVLFKDCRFAQSTNGNLIVYQSASANNDSRFETCNFLGFISVDGGAISLVDSVVDSDSTTAAVALGTTGSVFVEGCSITDEGADGLEFTAQPNDAAIRNNRVTSDDYDINATVAITGLVIEGNVLWGSGISPNVSHVKSERNVGQSGDMDWYGTLQSALTSCTFNDIVIKMLKDETLAAALTPPSYKIVIDGNGNGHTITRGAGAAIMTVGASDDVTFRYSILVGSLDVSGNGALLSVVDCDMTGFVDVAAGDASTKVHILRSRLEGDATDKYAVRLQDADPTVVVEDSYLSGISGFSAVYYLNVTNNNLKMRRTKCFHGSLGANNPFARSAAQTPNWRGYQLEMNADPDTSGWSTNLVAAGQQQNAIDANTDFW